MSLQTRLNALVGAIGADIKALQASSWKTAVRFKSNTSITIASPGANIDGVAAVAGDRVLLGSQLTASEKGIWIWNGAAVPMTRATDADTAAKLPLGTTVMVTDGTNNQWTVWQYLSGAFTAQQWANNVYFSNASRISGTGSQVIVTAGGVGYTFDTTGLSMNSKKVQNVADPTAAQDAATKLYVDTHPIAVVSALPASPIDGQECYYLADSAKGIVWHLKYRAASSSAYKWEYVGGPPLYHNVPTDEPLAASATPPFTDLATMGPTVTTVLVGDYHYEAQATIYANAALDAPAFGVTFNGVDPAAPYQHKGSTPIANINVRPTISIASTALALTANCVIKMRYQTSAAAIQNFRGRTLKVWPIRVG